MYVVENDYVIEAFAADASDDSLRIRILPRASWSRPHFPNTHSLNSVLEVFPIDSISITNQIARCLIIRKRFDDLLCRPSRLRMFGQRTIPDDPYAGRGFIHTKFCTSRLFESAKNVRSSSYEELRL